VRVLQSIVLVDRGQLSEGAAEMTELLSHWKGNTSLLRNLGFIYIKAQRYDEAISIFNSITEIAPLCHEAYLGAAAAYYLKGSRDMEREYFQKAMDLISDSAEASLARCALSGGDPAALLLRLPLLLIEPFQLFQLLSFPSLKAIEIPPPQDPTIGE
jgi:tetratricopeptide (TPR) repeat protein